MLLTVPAFGQEEKTVKGSILEKGMSDLVEKAGPKLESYMDSGWDDKDKQAATFDLDQLSSAIDGLTATVNTHTDQIAELDKRDEGFEARLKALEAEKQLASSSGFRPLSSTLKPASTLSSTNFGSDPIVSSGGSSGRLPMAESSSWGSSVSSSGNSTGNVTRNVSSRFMPVASEISYIPEPPAQYRSMPNVVRPVVNQAPLLMAPLPPAPAPIQRREIVQMPVQRTITQTASYQPVSNCPGGYCPVNAAPVVASAPAPLFPRLRSRRQTFRQ